MATAALNTPAPIVPAPTGVTLELNLQEARSIYKLLNISNRMVGLGIGTTTFTSADNEHTWGPYRALRDIGFSTDNDLGK